MPTIDPLAAELLQLEHQGRHHSLRRGRAQGDENLFAEVSQQLEQAEPGCARDAAQYHHDEEDGYQPHIGGELRQRLETAQAILSDGICHAAEGADGRKAHDETDDAEHAAQKEIQQIDQRARGLAELRESQAEEHAEEDDLQHIAADKGIADAGWNDVQQKVRKTQMLCGCSVSGDGFRIQRSRIDVHPPPGTQHGHGYQSHQQRDRGDHLKVKQRFDTYASNFLQVAHARDANDDAGKDDGRKRQADQTDKSITQRLERDCLVREEHTHEDAEHDGHQNL